MADANFDDVFLLVPGIGANNSTIMRDYSKNNHGFSNTGNAKTITADTPYGSALSFSGSNRIHLDTFSILDFNTNPFTLQCWIKLNGDATTNAFFDVRPPSGSPVTQFVLSVKNTGTGTNIIRMFYGSGSVEWDGVLSPNTEHHVALSGAAGDGSLKCFVDGVQGSISSGSLPASLGANRAISIGGPVDGSTHFNGLMWDVELTMGVARYTTGFTPPTQLCPAVTGVAKIGNTAAHEIQSYSVDYPSGLYLPTATPSTDGSYEVFTVNTKQTVVCHHEDPENTVTATPEAAIVEPGGTQNFYGINEGANNVGGINSILLSTL